MDPHARRSGHRLNLGRPRPARHRLLARDIMTPEPVTVDAATSIEDARHLMGALKIRHLPVVVEGKPIGMISHRDVMVLGDDASFAERAVGTVIDAQLVSVEPSAPLEKITDLMLEHHVGALAVVDRDSQKLAGIISYVDVLAAMRRSLR